MTTQIDAAAIRRLILALLGLLAFAGTANGTEAVDSSGATPPAIYRRLKVPATVGGALEERGLTVVRVPLAIARRARGWTFVRGTRESRVFDGVWAFEHVTGVRYWIAYAGTRPFFVSFDEGGWYEQPIVGSVALQNGIPLFVTVEDDGHQYVRWGDELMGPFRHVERVDHEGDQVLIAVTGKPDPIEFMDWQD